MKAEAMLLKMFSLERNLSEWAKWLFNWIDPFGLAFEPLKTVDR